MNIPTRWLEVADSPAAAAVALLGILCSIGVGSCTSTGHVSPVSPRTARSPQRESAARTAVTEGEPVLRVRLLGDVREVSFSGPRSLVLEPEDRAAARKTIGTPVKALLTDQGWVFRDGSGTSIEIPGAALRVRGGDPGMHVKVNDSPYPGEFTLRARAARSVAASTPAPSGFGTTGGGPAASSVVSPVRTFDVIEHIAIEEYLPGVISRELLPNWSLNAFKAQAIAARSYALHERERSTKAREAYDVESSQLDQVYGGAVDHAVANRAVAETRGQVLMYEGHVLRAYYSSTCGGRPAAARHVWPTTRGFEFNLDAPIQGTQGTETACAFSPRTKWSVTRTKEDLVKRLSAYGRDQGLAVRGLRVIDRVEPSAFTPDKRPTNYRVIEPDGRWYALSAEQLRTGCNWTGTSGQPAVTAQTRVLSGDVEFTALGASFRIDGRGFGHGVGLCQYGAEGMSRNGATPEEIVRHYYPGATLEKLY